MDVNRPTRRAVLGTLAAGALAVPLSACSRLSGDSGDDEKTVRWAQFYTTQSGAAAEANKRWLAKVRKAFEDENSGWKVRLEGYQWDQIDQRMILDLRANVPHDVTLTSPQLMAQHDVAGSLRDLSDYVAKWSGDERKDFEWSPVYESARVSGKLLGIPLGVATRALAINEKLYRRANIDPAGVRTLDDLVRVSRKLDTSGLKGLAVYLGPDRATTELSFAPLVWHFGGDFFDEKAMEASFTSDASVQAAQWLLDAVYEAKVVPASAYAPTAVNDDVLMGQFVAGKSAQSFGYGSYWNQSLEDEGLTKGCSPATAECRTSGATVLPVPTKDHAMFSNGWLASIGAKSKNPEMAWKLVEVMLRPENLRAYPDAGLPARKSEYERPAYSSEFYRTWAGIARDGRGMPKTRYYSQLSDSVAAALQEIVGKRRPVRDTFRKYEDEWNTKYAGK